ncbi:MAG: cyclopropane-fatty-acyl-phospholipid synthase family protein [Bryobacteraceae bacterium]|jgi:cyclopropane-fatty-acyl-phospholipid synthase
MNQSNTVLHGDLSGERRSSVLDNWLLQRVFKGIGPAPIRMVLHETEAMPPSGVKPVATLWIRDRRTLLELALDPEVGFGEAYSAGRIELDGDLVQALDVVYQAMLDAHIDFNWYQRLKSKWMGWIQANTLNGSRHNIHRHYDLGNDFYKLWLDRELAYTCAYFPSPSATLEEAQLAKMDYICRKLRLQPGETVVEAGCGWGALALHMARHYGVGVKAFNISREQIRYATQRAAESGLSGQVEFIEDDYRNIRGKFDVFVSVGMLEHVGAANYAEFGNVIHRAVGDSGRGLLHFIGRTQKGDFSRWIRKRIFPGAYAPTLREVMDVLEPQNYSVLDIENLRLHYGKTLEHWLCRFEKAHDQVVAGYDSWFERAWRLYLAGSIAGFRTGYLQLFQITFAGCKCAPVSWTRAPLYAQETAAHELL